MPASADALALLDTLPCGLLQTSEDGRILRANRTFCAWVGRDPAELVGVARFQDFLTVGGRIFHQTHWTPLLRMQGSVSEVKLEVRHADGTTLPVIWNVIRHEQDGVIVHDLAAYIARDRDAYERELLQSRRRLEELVVEGNRLQAEAKDRATFAEQMVGIVSHDLRNPLSSIVMGTALLSGEQLTPKQQRLLQNVMRSTERARALISDLLDFTQARLGQGLSVVKETIDLEATIAETVAELAAIHPGRRLEHVHAGTGPCRADPNRLAQLVGNLVSNAMVHGRPDAPVTVASTIEDTHFSVSVHNEGTPIPDDIRTVLFEPMTRGTKATSAGRSVGLGLFIVSQIAKSHDGTATVDSIPESGTTFTATFPSA